MIDITDMKATEQSLHDAIKRLEDAQSLAKLGDWTCDLTTGAMTWSPLVYELFERNRALEPLSWAELVEMFEEGPLIATDAFELAQTTNEPQSFDATIRRSNGVFVVLEIVVLLLADTSGSESVMRGTLQDVTTRKAVEQKLLSEKEAAEASNETTSSFLATMSHEIRTPLNGILGLIEVISLTLVNPEIRGALEAVQESGRSLRRILDDILDFSKAEAGKLEIFPEPTRIADVIESVHRIYSGSAKSLGLEFSVYVDPKISPILILDPLRLRQILSNFVSNSIKFTRQGSVELRVLSEGQNSDLECLRFEVMDTGIGISAEDQQMLFQQFRQAHSIANRFGGTGLGLSISRRLAELMGGQISMSSELGVGTTLKLHIVAFVGNPAVVLPTTGTGTGTETIVPKQLAEGIALPGEKILSTERTGSELLILVVDDHPTNRTVMRSQISALGYDADDVESGVEALERWRTGKYKLVVTDLNMPNMSGYELSRCIREAENGLAGCRTPIIACSANVIPGVVESCLEAGMDDYMAKPISLKVMQEKLGKWLGTANHPDDVSPQLSEEALGASDESSSSGTESGTRPAGLKFEFPITQRAIALFRKVNDLDVIQLLAAIQEGDMEAVTHLSHRIKGASSFVGASGLVSVCAMIEQAGREKDAAAVAWLMDAFHIELEQLYAALDA